MADSLTRRRGGIRATTTSDINKILPMLREEADPEPPKMRIIRMRLEHNLQRLYALDEQIQTDMTGKDADKEVTDTEAYNDYVLSTMGQVDELLLSMSGVHNNSSTEHGEHSAGSLKVPKFTMAAFKGEPLRWQPFWEVFKSSIHNNKTMSAIEKFSYLRGYLEGDAQTVVEGYSLTEANYPQALEALHDRYGNKQTVKFAHFQDLIGLEPAKNRSLEEVRRVSEQCEIHIRSLVALDVEEETFSLMFVSIILSKLPEYLRTKVCEKTGMEDWSLAKLRGWIKADIRARETSESSADKNGQKQNAQRSNFNQGQRANTTTSTLTAPGGNTNNRSQSSGNQCMFCSRLGHRSEDCYTYINANVDDRYSMLRNNRACFTCLQSGHPSSYCDQKNRLCQNCKETGHHVSICGRSKFSGPRPQQKWQGNSWQPKQGQQSNQKQWSNSSQSSNKKTWNNKNQKIPHGDNTKGQHEDKSSTPQKTAVTVAVAQGADRGETDVAFLQTALVQLQDESGEKQAEGRLLMDSASSRTYIRENLCRELGLQSVGTRYISVGRFGTTKRATRTAEQVRVNVICRDGSIQPVLATVTPIISCPVSRTPINPKEYPIVNDITLAEPLNSVPDSLEIDILVGSDQYYNFAIPNQYITAGPGNGLVFVNSRLGYLTGGTMPVTKQEHGMPESTLVLLRPEAEIQTANESLDIERFWQIEDVGAKDAKPADLTDEEALRQFQETVQFHDGRYHVTWPWKSKEPDLPNNYGLAYGRLRSTMNRLHQDENLLVEYNNIIQKQAEKGIIEKAPEKPDGLVYYVPHHPIITPSKITTKVRIVYDASSKARKDVPSLNDCLLRGPVILDDLCGLLMRFRVHKVALVSDIEKAFLQVRLQMSERDVGRFLWVLDTTKPPTGKNVVHYRFTSVFFGAVSSPFLLGATIDTHLRRAEGATAKKIQANIYVDNVITGEADVQSAINHYREAKSLFSGASMNLREFYTNSIAVRDQFAPEDRGNSKEPKILGIKWDLETDTMRCCGLKPEDTGKVTKRRITQHVAELYDPCGWFAPVVVTGKLLIQELWKLDLAWDEPVPTDISARWQKVRNELSRIAELPIPRFLGETQSVRLELHAFCDASQLASAVCVYLRKEGSESTTCDILFAKTRLAPLKPPQTIPRLELVALVMGANLIDFVERQLRLPISKKTVWSDAQCVLCWLTKENLETKFVERRIHEIRKKTDITYRYVPSAYNPADLPSRGCGFDDLQQNPHWWHGPPWLVKSPGTWPKDRTAKISDVPSDAEEVHHLAVIEGEKPTAVIDPQKYSSLRGLLRVTAFVQRFIHNARVPLAERQSGTLTVHQMSLARSYWESLAQRQGFPGLQERLSPAVLRRSAMAQLHVFRDTQGLLRCGGRISNAQLPYDCQHPVLLPKNHPYTYLAIRHSHVTSGHAGVAQTLSAVRQRYWVVQGRSHVKRVLRNCQRCRRIEGGPYNIPQAPPLPDFRVTEQAPFTATGLDYLGFLQVKTSSSSRELQKVWVCLFTCAASRAIHLELVENQSADEFHLALRRFFAVHGYPKLIVSDNASQFIAVETAMKKLWKELTSSADVENLTSTHDVDWKKIPQVAPWMGGFYERLVGTVKKFLKKTLDGLLCQPQ